MNNFSNSETDGPSIFWLGPALLLATSSVLAQDGPPAPAPFAPVLVRTVGCSLQREGPDASGLPTPVKTTGDPALDARVHGDLSRLAPWFQVYPRLYFMDDTRQPNAVSLGEVLGDPDDFPPERSQFGTVLFGRALLQSELRSTPQGQPNYTVTAILAHELGHTLQIRRNNTLAVVHKELHADFLAGWTIRYMQRAGAQDVDEGDVFSTFYKKGDILFNRPDHHGTRKERLASFLAGFEVEDNDVNLVYDKAENFVRSIPIDNGERGAPSAPNEYFANNLGVYYVAIPNPDGTSALKVSRPPCADSPGGQGGLELGDIILQLDSMPFRGEQDVLGHTGRTTISVIDVKTGERQEAVLELP